MTDLEQYFRNNQNRLIHKWKHYFDIYERYFAKYRGQEVVILEIGVFHGGSLQMWKSYFGDKAKIYGIDIDPKCKELEEENIQIFIGSQSDRAFLQQVKAQIPDIDILIDDGGHTMQQQIVSFEELYAKVKPNGIYLCEDTMTSYWLEYGGGFRRRGTFIEYSKRFVDSIHAWHSGQADFKKDHLTASLASVAFYDGIVVLEKKPMEKPHTLQSGQSSFESENPAPKSRRQKLNYQALLWINKLLQKLKLPGFIWR